MSCIQNQWLSSTPLIIFRFSFISTLFLIFQILDGNKVLLPFSLSTTNRSKIAKNKEGQSTTASQFSVFCPSRTLHKKLCLHIAQIPFNLLSCCTSCGDDHIVEHGKKSAHLLLSFVRVLRLAQKFLLHAVSSRAFFFSFSFKHALYVRPYYERVCRRVHSTQAYFNWRLR